MTTENERTAQTSITDTAVRRFLKEAKLNDTLACDVQTGFHLRKIAKGGSWRYRYNDATGKRKVKTIGTYPAMKAPEAAWWAQEWRHNGVDPLEQKKHKRQTAIQEKSASEKRTLQNFLEGDYARHLARQRNKGLPTLAIIRNSFPEWLGRDMATLTEADLLAWQSKQEEKGLRAATLKRKLNPLKAMLRYAAKKKVLDTNPLQEVVLEKPSYDEHASSHSIDEQQAERRMLTDDERTGMFNGLDLWDEELRQKRRNSRAHGKPNLPSLDDAEFAHWFIPFCNLGFHTGLRPGDLYSLTWRELNIEVGRIQKYPEKTLHNPDPVKIDLPLNAEIKSVMTRWWEQCGKPTDGLVFRSERTGGRLSKTAHQKPWGNVKRLGKLSDDLVFYSLRHNFISTLLHLGVQIFEVARMVGHKSSKMIEEHYGHLCPAAAASAMEAFGKSFSSKGNA